MMFPLADTCVVLLNTDRGDADGCRRPNLGLVFFFAIDVDFVIALVDIRLQNGEL